MRISDWSSDLCSSDLRALDQLCIWPDLSQALSDGIRHALGAQAVLERVGGDDYFHTYSPVPVHGTACQLSAVVQVHAIGLPSTWLSRSEEHTSELQSLMRISYAVFCLKKNTHQ